MPDRVATRLALNLEQLSKGRAKVRVHGEAAFGDEREHLSLLRKGTLDLAVTGDLVVTSLAPAYLVVNMPFLYRDAAHALAAYSSGLGLAMRKDLRTMGVHALSWHHVGMRTLTANKPITDLNSLQGLKLRLPPDAAWMAVWRALGATPIAVPFNGLHTALKLGRVEAQDNPPNFTRSGRLYEHQTHLMTTQHMPQRQFVFAASKLWRQWSNHTQHWVTEAAREASEWAVDTAAAEEQKDLNWLQTEGHMKRVVFDRQGVDRLLAPVAKVLGGEAGVRVFERIRGLV